MLCYIVEVYSNIHRDIVFYISCYLFSYISLPTSYLVFRVYSRIPTLPTTYLDEQTYINCLFTPPEIYPSPTYPLVDYTPDMQDLYLVPERGWGH